MSSNLETMVRNQDFTTKSYPLSDLGYIKTFLRTKSGGIIAVDNLQQVFVFTKRFKLIKKFNFNLPFFNKKGVAVGNYVFFCNINRRMCAFNFKKKYLASHKFNEKTNNFFQVQLCA